MVKYYKRQPGSRKYGDYTKVLRSIKMHQMTQREAAKHYKIPISTIKNEVKGLHCQPCGAPKVLHENEEIGIAENCIKFVFHIGIFDLRCIV